MTGYDICRMYINKMKYSVAQNNTINNIVALFTDATKVLKSSILFEIKRENVIYLANSVM